MTVFLNNTYRFFSGAYEWITSYFRSRNVSAAAAVALNSQRDLTPAARVLQQLTPAMESCRSWTATFYAILGKETPAMRELRDCLAGIELGNVITFSSEFAPAKNPAEYFAAKQRYVIARQKELDDFVDQGFTGAYMQELQKALPPKSAARREYERIARYLQTLKGVIQSHQTGTLIEEVMKFGPSVRAEAVSNMLLTYVGQEDAQKRAYDLLVAYVETCALVATEQLKELQALDASHPRVHTILKHALKAAQRIGITEAEQVSNRRIYEQYKLIFPDD